jgi:hypothetical protein
MAYEYCFAVRKRFALIRDENYSFDFKLKLQL